MKEAKVLSFDFENLRYLRFLLLALIEHELLRKDGVDFDERYVWD
jgi:hypothetical protein